MSGKRVSKNITRFSERDLRRSCFDTLLLGRNLAVMSVLRTTNLRSVNSKRPTCKKITRTAPLA